MASSREFATFAEFWAFYLSEHHHASTRWLHFAGTTAAVALAVAAVVSPWHWLGLLAPLAGYGPAWVGHFFIEHNRPATWKYPLRSFAADFVLWWAMVRGRLG